MNLHKQIVRILGGVGLAVALAFVPGTSALSPFASAGQVVSASSTATQSGKLDINAATEDQLKVLPGVGDVFAKRIIAGRPYRGKNQLVSKGILPQAVYDKIKDQIIAHHVKK